MLQEIPFPLLLGVTGLVLYLGRDVIIALGNHFCLYMINRINSWMFLLRGADMITAGYKKAGGKAFDVPGPDHNHTFISSSEHLADVRKASRDELSLFGATKQMFQPAYTMFGHNWLDERGAEGIGYVRAVGTLFPKRLQYIMPEMKVITEDSFEKFAQAHKTKAGEYHLPVYDMYKKVVCKMNGHCFFGEELSNNDLFMEKIHQYNEIVINAAEVLRVLPECMKWMVGPYVGRTKSVQTIVFDMINGLVARRMEAKKRRDAGIEASTPPNDMVQWIIDTAPVHLEWTSRRVTYELIAIWFGSVHALSASAAFALFDLCSHPEYVEPLRQEVEGSEFDEFMKTARGLPLLDSFVKESTRLNPIESMAGRRQALKDFMFSDGTLVKKGDWAVVPSKAIQLDESYFPQADTFQGFRFAPRDKLPSNVETVSQPNGPSKYADISDHYHSWGIGGIVCPGRFYAATATKLIMAHILKNYDVSFVKPEKKLAFIWRSYVLPREDTLVNFVPRQKLSVV